MAQQDDHARITLRVPRDVYAAVERGARLSGRSVNNEIVDRIRFQSTELSVRDWFAGQALTKLITLIPNRDGEVDLGRVAYDSYVFADAMIHARAKGNAP